jgi:hypothetical protein
MLSISNRPEFPGWEPFTSDTKETATMHPMAVAKNEKKEFERVVMAGALSYGIVFILYVEK